MTIRLCVLGGFRAFRDGNELDELPSQRVRAAILTCIAVERRITRDTLSSLIWPETDTRNARQSLRQNLFTLRQAIGDGWVESTALELKATDQLWCDAHSMEMAAQTDDAAAAANLYSGPFLNGIHLISNRAWEGWVERHRGQSNRTFRRVCRNWVDRLESAGDVEGAIRAAHRWLEPDAIDDEAQHRLIAALARAGRRTEALRQYDEYLVALQLEDLEPLDDTKQLIVGLRRTDREESAEAAPPSKLPVPAPTLPQVFQTDSAPLDGYGAHDVAEPAPNGPAFSSRLFGLSLNFLPKAAAKAAAIAAALTVVMLVVWNRGESTSSRAGARVDTLTYALFPIPGDTFGLGIRFAEALASWRGLTVLPVDGPASEPRPTRTQLPSDEHDRIARRVAAGRFITAELLDLRDSLGIRAQIWDTHLRMSTSESVVWIKAGTTALDEPITQLTESLLLGVRKLRPFAAQPPRSRVRTARLAFEAALDHVQNWNLDAADTLLVAALADDRHMVEAHLWLALVRAWNGRDRSTWNSAATLAHDGATSLTPPAAHMSQAIYYYSRQRIEDACRLWISLTEEFSTDPTVWFGMGHCLLNDSTVVADRSSPSGFRFRSSHHSAVRAYREAFMRMPTVHRALRARGYESVRRILRTDRSFRKEGRGVDGTRFFATTFWDDSLVFYPVPYDSSLTTPDWLTVLGVTRAIQHQRQVFYEIASSWVNEFPRSPYALQAMATALEMQADVNAIEIMQRARLEAASDADWMELAVSDLWLRVRFALQPGASDFEPLRALADSILSSPHITHLDPSVAAAIAALMGRGDLATEFAIRAGDGLTHLPPLVRAPAMEFLARAALRGPVPELLSSEHRLTQAIAMTQPPLEPAHRNAFLTRGRTLAFVELGHRAFTSDGDPLLEAQLAASAGLNDRAYAILRELHGSRSNIHPAEIALDALVPEAHLLVQMRDLSGALALLAPTLDQLVLSAPRRLESVAAAASLGHAMVLRASLESRVGNRASAQIWAQKVVTLWRDADAFLQPFVRDMMRIANK